MPDWTALRKSLLPEKASTIVPPSIKLPVLPRALTEFSRKSEDPSVNVEELSKILATDSGLSSELLRTVNSSRTGIRNQVTSVRQALVILGVRATRLHLTTSGMKQVMKSSSSKLINFQCFWNTNLERALFARELAKLLNADCDLAFTAGMLQDFLLPLITNQLIDGYLHFAENLDAFSNLVSFEQKYFGWDHAEAAAGVMSGWQFPDELICCVCLHHRGIELLADEQLRHTSAAAVAVSALLPDPLRQEPNGIESLIKLEEEWPEFQLLPIAERVDSQFQTIAQDTQNHFPFLHHCRKAVERYNAAC